jgi:hypothetical protein
MKTLQRLCRSLFWLVTGGLIAFCLAFGLPFLSKIAAGKVVAMAGCTPPSFDLQAVCPAGSYAEKFVPLSHWFTSLLAPLVLVQNFGGLLAGWAALAVALGVAYQLLKRQERGAWSD